MEKTDLIKILLPYLRENPESVLSLFGSDALRKALIVTQRNRDKTGLEQSEFIRRQRKIHGELSMSYFYKILRRKSK